ncbi:MAG: sporulation protein YqfD [Clostridia bacterium]|nr:sporulation protein YqfD [Clostridia bacterium]
MGKYPERLINRCFEGGIALYGLERRDWGASAVIRARDFKRLRALSRGSGNRIRILEKRGIPRLKAFVRRNAVFIAALGIFIAAALSASTRLWFVRIETVSIPEAEVREMLRALSVYVGAPKDAFTTSGVAHSLDLDPRIANARVKLEGVTLYADISETVGTIPEGAEDHPASIYADKDCVIRFISAARGHAAVREGQAVKAGDLLITGDLSELKEGLLVRADGLILGETVYTAKATAPLTVEKSQRSGSSVAAVGISVFGRVFFFGLPYDEYELELVKTGRLSPVGLTVTEYRVYELKTMPVTDTASAAEKRARLKAQEKVFELLPRGARILAVSTECYVNEDGSVTAVICVTVIEPIGVRRDI